MNLFTARTPVEVATFGAAHLASCFAHFTSPFGAGVVIGASGLSYSAYPSPRTRRPGGGLGAHDNPSAKPAPERRLAARAHLKHLDDASGRNLVAFRHAISPMFSSMIRSTISTLCSGEVETWTCPFHIACQRSCLSFKRFPLFSPPTAPDAAGGLL